MLVKIYIYQTIKGKEKAGAYTYILATELKGKEVTLTKTDILEPMTEYKAELTVLLKALKRLRKECDLEVIGLSQYLKNGCEKWIENWNKSNWMSAKGKEIANKEEWKQVYEYLRKLKFTVNTTCEHSYYKWMKKETEKQLEAVKERKE